MSAGRIFRESYMAAMLGVPPTTKSQTVARVFGAAIGRIITAAEYTVGVVVVGKLFGVL